MVKEPSFTKGRKGSYMGLTPLQATDKLPAYLYNKGNCIIFSPSPEGTSHTHTSSRYLFTENKASLK